MEEPETHLQDDGHVCLCLRLKADAALAVPQLMRTACAQQQQKKLATETLRVGCNPAIRLARLTLAVNSTAVNWTELRSVWLALIFSHSKPTCEPGTLEWRNH